MPIFKCHDISMITHGLENISVVNVKGVDYSKCVLHSMTKNDAINRLNNF